MGVDKDELLDPDACDEELECLICKGILVEAVACSCENMFCRLCIERVLDGSGRCPVCRQTITADGLQACNLINIRVNSLVMCCERRCGWYGRRDQRLSHTKVCPVRKDMEFAASLSGQLGLTLETTVGEFLVVGWVCEEGAGPDHNKRMERCAEKQIRPGSIVVEANGIRGDCHKLLYVIRRTAKKEGAHRLVFRQPTEFRTTVQRRSKELGLEVALKEEGGSFLEILSVLPGGAVMEHNTANEDGKLRSHDRIVEVNGVQGDGRDILKCIQSSETCDMKICRVT